jgi:GT2 family glycosyltransferase
MKIGIVLPVINLWEKYTKACLESIKTRYDYEIFLIDNASADGTANGAKGLDKVNYIKNTERKSCAASWNQGIGLAIEKGCDTFFVINNDVILHPEAINELVLRLEKGDVTMSTCMDVRGDCGDPQDVIHFPISSELEESEHPNFSAFMMTLDCWNKVGKFDEEFKPAYFEDNDYHYRMKLLGLKAITLPLAVFYHYGSRTQNEALNVPAVPSYAFESNRAYYMNKWGGNPGEEVFKTPFNK